MRLMDKKQIQVNVASEKVDVEKEERSNFKVRLDWIHQ